MVDLVDYVIEQLDQDVHQVFQMLVEDQQQLLILDFLQILIQVLKFVKQLNKNMR